MLTMSQPATLGNPRNHAGCDGCDGSRPLTLADRERLHGRSLRQHDQTRDYHDVYCTECLADLPHGFAAEFHVCGQEPVRVGDVVRYHGRLTEYHGTVWEVTHIDHRGLILFDVDRALWNVHPSSVTVGTRPKTPEPGTDAGAG